MKSIGTLEFNKIEKMKCPVQICACVFVSKATLAVVCLLCTNFGFAKLHVEVEMI
jgi:hypothetical protein